MTEPEGQRIAKFNGENFYLWKFKIQMLLEEKGLWGYVTGEKVLQPRANDQATRDFNRKARRALATICLSLDDSQLMVVRSAQTAEAAWAALESHFETKTLANKLTLKKELFSLRMSTSDSMLNHINKLRALAGKLEAIDAGASEEDQVTLLLCSLPTTYNGLITALESRPGDLSLEFVTARLLHEEAKMKELDVSVSDELSKALVMSKPQFSKSNFKEKYKCYSCGKQGHVAKDCYNKQELSRSRRSGCCNYCGKEGHWARDCRLKQSKRTYGSHNHNHHQREAKFASGKDDGP